MRREVVGRQSLVDGEPQHCHLCGHEVGDTLGLGECVPLPEYVLEELDENRRRHNAQASADVIRAGITLLLALICGYLGWHIVRAISSGAVQRAIEGVR